MLDYERSIDDVVETLRNGKDRGISCCLLVGAGCSVTAGIPLASGFVDEIARKYPSAFATSDQKSYADSMASLSIGERRSLIRQYIDGARINEAHLGIAQLIKHGYVDRVLTTNFDPLISRACVLCNAPIAIYDFAATQHFDPADAPTRSVFHLHGQHTGFRLLNTEEECNGLGDAISPLFEDSGRGRIWIVIGYSGVNDPVFEQLAAVERFDHRLFWVGYNDQAPSADVLVRLLSADKYAFHVGGFDADGFFAQLARNLNCFPPEIISHPFQHLKSVFSSIQPQTDSEYLAAYGTASRIIDKAITELENEVAKREPRMRSLIRNGQPEVVVEEYEKLTEDQQNSLTESETRYVAHAYNACALKKIDPEFPTEEGFQEAIELYSKAGVVAPDVENTFNNVAIAWTDFAAKFGEEKHDEYLLNACENCEEAIKRKPDYPKAYFNWGIALKELAFGRKGDRKRECLGESEAKFKKALELQGDYSKAHHELGRVQSELAKLSGDDERVGLLVSACKNFAAAEHRVEGDEKAEVLIDWGVATVKRAEIERTASAREELLLDACAKFSEADQLEVESHVLYQQWGSALTRLSQTQPEEKRASLLEEASKRLKKALRINASDVATFQLGGDVALYQSDLVEGAEKLRLLEAACLQYQNATLLDHLNDVSYAKWGQALFKMAMLKEGEDRSKTLGEAHQLLIDCIHRNPRNARAFISLGVAQVELAEFALEGERISKLEEACEQFEHAIKLDQNDWEGFVRLGTTLLEISRDAPKQKRDRLVSRARDVLVVSEEMKPGSGALALARLAALEGQVKESVKWLKVSRDTNTLPDCDELESDESFHLVKDRQLYQNFINRLKLEHRESTEVH